MRLFIHGLLLASLTVWAGCGGEAGLDGTTAVSGVVTYKGQPVEGANISFSPTGGTGRAASALTDAEGRFQLTTLKPGDGALPGSYQVAVSKTEVQNAMTPEEAQAYFEKHLKTPEVKHKELLPAKYKHSNTSGLSAEVTEGGENNFTFDLND